MSGLDKMKTRILEEAGQSAREIIDNAKAEAQNVIDMAEANAQSEASKILEQAEKDAADYARRAESSVDMRRKQAYLAAKQEVIGRILEKAYEKVMDMDTDKYFEMLETLLEKNVLSENGEICFSKKDLARMPEGFKGRIKEIAAKKGGSLTVSENAGDIDGGFLLLYGGIEENCTLKAVFEAKKEELSDQVNRLLFR